MEQLSQRKFRRIGDHVQNALEMGDDQLIQRVYADDLKSAYDGEDEYVGVLENDIRDLVDQHIVLLRDRVIVRCELDIQPPIMPFDIPRDKHRLDQADHKTDGEDRHNIQSEIDQDDFDDAGQHGGDRRQVRDDIVFSVRAQEDLVFPLEKEHDDVADTG